MKTFDFIIVGGGTSGTITATKLVENGHSVLLIEEGGNNNNPLLSMPAAVSYTHLTLPTSQYV